MSGPKYIITSDVHFTDKPADKYRLGLLPWLGKQARDRLVDAVFILGDLTMDKDRHTGKLTNVVVQGLAYIAEVCPVHILCGNHDYHDKYAPFFMFVDHIPNLTFINEPGYVEDPDNIIIAIPHTETPIEDFKQWADETTQADFVFLHHTFNRAVAENGVELEGLSQKLLKLGKHTICVSGDIHVPQTVGRVRYVGSPYHVHFGDKFDPRVFFVNGGHLSNLRYHTLRRYMCEIKKPQDLLELGMVSGDQAKIRLYLPRAELSDWTDLKRQCLAICADIGVEVFNVSLGRTEVEKGDILTSNRAMAQSNSPRALFDVYCKKGGITGFDYDVGLHFLEESEIDGKVE